MIQMHYMAIFAQDPFIYDMWRTCMRKGKLPMYCFCKPSQDLLQVDALALFRYRSATYSQIHILISTPFSFKEDFDEENPSA